MRLLLVIGIVLFAESAFYGVWWRFGIAQIYLLECLSLITDPAIQWRFQAHIYLFMAGLAAVGALVLAAFFKEPKNDEFYT